MSVVSFVLRVLVVVRARALVMLVLAVFVLALPVLGAGGGDVAGERWLGVDVWVGLEQGQRLGIVGHERD